MSGGFLSMLESLAEAIDSGPASYPAPSGAPPRETTTTPPAVASRVKAEETATSLAGVGAWWKSFNLSDKKKKWEELGNEIAQQQDASAERRKSITEAVRTFRKLDDEAEKTEAIPGLLKTLQDEIDLLTKRSRSAEQAFLRIFAELLDAPDPVPSFQTADEGQQRVIRLQEETAALRGELSKTFAELAKANAIAGTVPALKTEIGSLELELGKLNDQSQDLKKLEDRIAAFEATVEDTVTERLALREVELRSIFDAELEVIREAETAAEAQVRSLKALLSETAAARDEAQSQLAKLEASSAAALASAAGSGGGSGGSGAGGSGSSGDHHRDVEALAADNERLKATVAALSAQLQQVGAGSGSGSGDESMGSSAMSSTLAAYQSRLSSLENELAATLLAQNALQEESKQRQERLQSSRLAHDKEAAASRESLSRKEQEVLELKQELGARPSAHELQLAKRKLRALQRMVLRAALLPASSPELSDLQPSASLLDSGRHHDDGLTLEDEATPDADAELVGIPTALVQSVGEMREAVRAQVAARKQLEGQLEESQKALEASEAALAAQRERVTHLEEALVGRAVGSGGIPISSPSRPTSAPSPEATAADDKESASAARHLATLLSTSSSGPAFPTPSLKDSSLPISSPSAARGGGLGGLAAGGDDALSILHGQREKLRSRVRELEDELQRSSSETLEAKVRAEKLLADNVQLYAKIRYLETFKGQQQQEQGAGGGGGDSVNNNLQGGGNDAANSARTDLSNVEPLQLLSFAVKGALRKTGLGGIAAPVIEPLAARIHPRKDATATSSSRSPASTTALAVSGGSAAAASSSGSGSDVEAPYRQLYNEAHDPFADFRRREKARQIEKLSTAEQIMLASSRFFLGHKAARTFLFIYLCGMHLLVFLTFWHFTHYSHGGKGECDGGGGPAPGMGASGAMQQRFLPTALRGGTSVATVAGASASPLPFASLE